MVLAACDMRLRTVTYRVTSPKVAAPVRLAVLADLHSCAYGRGQHTLLEAVAAQTPDAVLLVGDIVDDKLPEHRAWTVAAALAAEMPCCYVTGNHEWRSGQAERICREMEALGIAVLRGCAAVLDLRGQSIAVWGVDDPDSGDSERQLAQVGDEMDPTAFSLLLAHRPERIHRYLIYPFDLVISGHAHGGQWRIPGLLNGVLAPQQGLFPMYAGGRYGFRGTTFLVSRGLARENIPVPRIFDRPELMIVEILPEGADGQADISGP